MIENLIDKLIELDLKVELFGKSDLRVNSDISKVPNGILLELKKNKSELVDYLKSRQRPGGYKDILPSPKKNGHVVSSAQKRMWMICQFDEQTSAYNIPGIHTFNHEVNLESLRDSFKVVIERHEILRTVFSKSRSGQLQQLVLEPGQHGFYLEFSDKRDTNFEVIRSNLEDYISQPFNLTTGPLMRAHLYRVGEGEYIFSYVIHHIISDGWSMDLLMKELLMNYDQKERLGSIQSLPELGLQYKDYAYWQQEELRGGKLLDSKNYWLDQLGGELPVLELLGDYPRPQVRSYKGSTTSIRIESKEVKLLRQLGQDTGSSMFMLLLSGLKALFYRYTGQEDIVLGSPIAGRDHVDLQDQLGLYVNTLALRTQFKGSESYKALLSRVKSSALGGYEHQMYPFDSLVEDLGIKRDLSRHPLFDVMVILQNIGGQKGGEEISLGGVEISPYAEVGNKVSKFDMTFTFVEEGDEIGLQLDYNTDIYSKCTIARICSHYKSLMKRILEDPESSLDELDYISEDERLELLEEFRGETVTYEGPDTLVGMLEAEQERSGDQPALRCSGEELSYDELHDRSNQLGRFLRTVHGIGRDDLVGVKMGRGIPQMVVLLGILKSGGGYVPIDPEYPESRQRYIERDSGVKLIIDEIWYVSQKEEISGYSECKLEEVNNAEDLAYVIYTSGSTGDPKGVMIEHGGIVNRIKWAQSEYNLTSEDRVLQKTTYCFDVSVWELFWPLTVGSLEVMSKPGGERDTRYLLELIESEGISTMHYVPSMLDVFLDYLEEGSCKGLQRVLCSGESLREETVRRFRTKLPEVELSNLYGPTEASIDVTSWTIPKGEQEKGGDPPIGYPVSNTGVYILDKRGRLVPKGVAGELYLSGIQVARGYKNNIEENRLRFSENPYCSGERLYKTGDLGRWLEDGSIEYIGRKDTQVKIRGYRIELGEIESCVGELSGVERSVVLLSQGKEAMEELICYIRGDGQYTGQSVRAHLRMKLPEYMIPSQYVEVEEFPLTLNGKLDRKKLLQNAQKEINKGVEYIPASTELENKLVVIWSEVLAIEEALLSVTDSFFDLGGNSIKSMKIGQKVLEATGLNLPMKIIFEQRTIQNIARVISLNGEEIIPISYTDNTSALKNIFNISENQKVYFSDWNDDSAIVVSKYMLEDINSEVLMKTINYLIERHEILRTIFVKIDGAIKQKVLTIDESKIESPKVHIHSGSESLNKAMSDIYSMQFDLSLFPLFDVSIHSDSSNDEHIVILAMHHIIIDGYSGGVFRSELSEIYRAFYNGENPKLPQLQSQYKDFSHWQHSFIDSTAGATHRGYWNKKLAGCNYSLDLKLLPNLNDDETGTLYGRSISFDDSINENLELFRKTNELTTSSILLGALIFLCYKLTSQSEISVFCNASCRNSRYYGDLDVSNSIGMFSNSLLVSNVIREDRAILEIMKIIQKNFIQDLSYGDYPIGKIIEDMGHQYNEEFFRSTAFYNYHNYDYLKKVKRIEADEDKEYIRLGQTI